MRIAICDDNKIFLGELAQQINSIPLVETAVCFSDIKRLMQSLSYGEKFDAILMDIDWGSTRTGMDAAEEVYSLSPYTKIIYVTGYVDNFAQHIFLRKSNLSGFLSKPVDQSLLEANLQKVLSERRLEDSASITVKINGTVMTVACDDIHYIESHAHTAVIHTSTAQITVYERLQDLLKRLPEYFVQCHKSFLVNMKQIQRFQASEVLLKTGESVPVSRSRHAAAKNAYFTLVGLGG